MSSNLSIHLKMFNDKVKLMNQTHSKNITLSAQEARNLHSDIFDLLDHCATLSQKIQKGSTDDSGSNLVTVAMDGGNWSQKNSN